MAFIYKKQDDLEKILEEFVILDTLEEIESPDPKEKQTDRKNKKEVK